MTDDQASEFMVRFGAAFFKALRAALEAVVAPDAQWHFSIGDEPDGRVRHGVEGFIQGKAENDSLFENLRYHDVHCRALGESEIIMTYRVSGVWRATARPLNRRGIERVVVREGLLRLKDVFWKQAAD